MKIKQRKLGDTGISVNPIGLGTMPLAIGGRPDESEAIRVIHAALDSGMDFLDTADVYCEDNNDIGYCERLIAKALKTWKKKSFVLVATKGGLERPGGAWTVNGDPRHLKKACDASLKALNVSEIDLYQWHAPDPKVPFEESLGALIDLIQLGKIRYLGLSNVSLQQIKIARQMVQIVSIQNRCNHFDLRAFREGIIEYCENENISFIPYSPVGGSSGKHSVASHKELLKVAAQYNVTPFQIVLAWLLAKSPAIIPIPGASHIESAESSAKAMQLTLDNEDITLLDKAFF